MTLKLYKMGDILNFPHTEEAVDNGDTIYGPQIPLLKGNW